MSNGFGRFEEFELEPNAGSDALVDAIADGARVRPTRRWLAGAAFGLVLLGVISVAGYIVNRHELPSVVTAPWPADIELPPEAGLLDVAALPMGPPVQFEPPYVDTHSDPQAVVTADGVRHPLPVARVDGGAKLRDGVILVLVQEDSQTQIVRVVAYHDGNAAPTQLWTATHTAALAGEPYLSGTIVSVSPDQKHVLVRQSPDGTDREAAEMISLSNPADHQIVAQAEEPVWWLPDSTLLIQTPDRSDSYVSDGETRSRVRLPAELRSRPVEFHSVPGHREVVALAANRRSGPNPVCVHLLEPSSWTTRDVTCIPGSVVTLAGGEQKPLLFIDSGPPTPRRGVMDLSTGTVTWLPNLSEITFSEAHESNNSLIMGVSDATNAQIAVRCSFDTGQCERAPDPSEVVINPGIQGLITWP